MVELTLKLMCDELLEVGMNWLFFDVRFTINFVALFRCVVLDRVMFVYQLIGADLAFERKLLLIVHEVLVVGGLAEGLIVFVFSPITVVGQPINIEVEIGHLDCFVLAVSRDG